MVVRGKARPSRPLANAFLVRLAILTVATAILTSPPASAQAIPETEEIVEITDGIMRCQVFEDLLRLTNKHPVVVMARNGFYAIRDAAYPTVRELLVEHGPLVDQKYNEVEHFVWDDSVNNTEETDEYVHRVKCHASDNSWGWSHQYTCYVDVYSYGYRCYGILSDYVAGELLQCVDWPPVWVDVWPPGVRDDGLWDYVYCYTRGPQGPPQLTVPWDILNPPLTPLPQYETPWASLP